MRKKLGRGYGLWLVVLFGMAGTPILAHEQVGALGPKATATDVYAVGCNEGDASTELEVQIQDNKPVRPPVLRVTASKDDRSASAIDPVDADGKFGPFAAVRAGTGIYRVAVDKLASGKRQPNKIRNFAELYGLQFHCMTGTEHTDTSIRQRGCAGCKNQ